MFLRGQIDPKLVRKFRKTAMEKFGYGKGGTRQGCRRGDVELGFMPEVAPIIERGPVKAIEGLLKDINANSVTLQHEGNKLWARTKII